MVANSTRSNTRPESARRSARIAPAFVCLASAGLASLLLLGADAAMSGCRALLDEIKFAYVGAQIGWLYRLDPTAQITAQEADRRRREDRDAMWRWTQLYADMGCPMEAVGATIADARARLDKLIADTETAAGSATAAIVK